MGPTRETPSSEVCEQQRRRPAHPYKLISAFVILFLESIISKLATSQRDSYMVWEINIGVCQRLEFDNIMLFNCLGYDFYIYGAFGFLCNSIANL